MKYEYRIYVFKLTEVQEAQDFINEKSKNGYSYRITNIHYYSELEDKYVRYTMELITK